MLFDNQLRFLVCQRDDLLQFAVVIDNYLEERAVSGLVEAPPSKRPFAVVAACHSGSPYPCCRFCH